jgi:hypothetical protein
MSVFNMPTRDDLANYSFRTFLDRVPFRFDVNFNQRAQRWYISVFDDQGNPVRTSMPAVTEWLLMLTVVTSNRPAGDLMVLPQGTDDSEPLLGQLGDTSVLLYLDQSEL